MSVYVTRTMFLPCCGTHRPACSRIPVRLRFYKPVRCCIVGGSDSPRCGKNILRVAPLWVFDFLSRVED